MEKKSQERRKGMYVTRYNACVAATVFPCLLNVEGKVCSVLTWRASGQAGWGLGREQSEGGAFTKKTWPEAHMCSDD